MANYEYFYPGNFSSMNPYYGGFVGYRLSAENLGAPTKPDTANQINEVISRIREGMKAVEVGTLQPEAFEQIPKEHLKEIYALAKLSGVKPSVHAPIIDAAGFGQRGWEGEAARQDAEKRIFDVVRRSHDLDPQGNIPITIHSSAGIPGNEYRPEVGKKPGDKDRFKKRTILMINRETGQIQPVQEQTEKFDIQGMQGKDWEKGRTITAETWAKNINFNEWDRKLTELNFAQQAVDKDMERIDYMISQMPQLHQIIQKSFLTEEESHQLNMIQPQIIRGFDFLKHNTEALNNMFNNAYKYGSEEQKKELKKLSENWTKEKNAVIKQEFGDREQKGALNSFKLYMVEQNLFGKYSNHFRQIIEKEDKEGHHMYPEIYQPLENFAMDQAAKTFGNVAFNAVKEFGKTAPIISVENMFQGMAFSKAEDMNKLIDNSRKQFVEDAVKSKKEGGLGFNREEAETYAKKFIGVTWDVGHLNMMKKSGFTDQDVVKETEKIAKNVKHLHLTDNFGYSDSHLPPGMGNVPIKEIMEQLEKAGFSGRQIVEAGGFVQHFQRSPHPYVLSSFGSQLYPMKMASYFDQVRNVMGNYFGSPMAYFPDMHMSTYGSKFSSLPTELGGQMPGSQSRFAGTPNA
ncbi:MAG: sugar phosphate isomerase/epimerase family protein [Nanoarchaeota archaeon]